MQRLNHFSFYARLIKPVKESNGKWAGHSNKKIGNHHLKWAIKEAAISMLRDSSQAKNYLAKLEKKYNKGKALGIFFLLTDEGHIEVAHFFHPTIYFPVAAAISFCSSFCNSVRITATFFPMRRILPEAINWQPLPGSK